MTRADNKTVDATLVFDFKHSLQFLKKFGLKCSPLKIAILCNNDAQDTDIQIIFCESIYFSDKNDPKL